MKKWWHNNKCTVCYCCYLYNVWLINADISSCCQKGMSSHYLPPTTSISHTEILIYIIPSLPYCQLITAYGTGIVFRSDIITQNLVVKFLCYTNFTPSWFGLLFMLHECWTLCTLECLLWWLEPNVLKQCIYLKTSVRIWRWDHNTLWKHQAGITQWCVAHPRGMETLVAPVQKPELVLLSLLFYFMYSDHIL